MRWRSDSYPGLGAAERILREEHITLLRLLSREQCKADPLPAGGTIRARGNIPGASRLLLRCGELCPREKLRASIDCANSDQLCAIGAVQTLTVHQLSANAGIAGFYQSIHAQIQRRRLPVQFGTNQIALLEPQDVERLNSIGEQPGIGQRLPEGDGNTRPTVKLKGKLAGEARSQHSKRRAVPLTGCELHVRQLAQWLNPLITENGAE